MEDLKEERYVDVSRINSIFEGKIIKSIEGLEVDNNYVEISFDDGNIIMHHVQDCCELVEIEDINGDKDLEGAIFYELIEKECDKDALNEYDESYSWTFYTIRTSKGYLDIRWYGTSNGYYSEKVDLDIKYKEEL